MKGYKHEKKLPVIANAVWQSPNVTSEIALGFHPSQ
jgi:hypothetical protein